MIKILKNIWPTSSDLIKILKNAWPIASTLISIFFIIFSDDLLAEIFNCLPITIIRIVIVISIFFISFILNWLYYLCRSEIWINGKNYKICVKYGDIFKMKNCKIVIPFDEIFSTKVGERPEEIKASSVCGQYLKENPTIDIKPLIDKAKLKPAEYRSKYKNMECYPSGKIVQNKDYLLLSFAKLDENGLGYFPTREEYIASLAVLWEELDKYYYPKDICIPIVGSGITRIGDSTPTQQELLDIIIYSYKLSKHKIKSPNTLYIICKKKDDFSLNKIGESY